MKIVFFILLTLLSCQDYNSNSGDKGRYGPVNLLGADAQFSTAYFIIQDRCVSCHDGVHNRWADFKGTNDWIAESYIVPGNAANSTLIKRVINTGGAAANMPPGGSPLSNEEYNSLKEWINALTPAATP